MASIEITCTRCGKKVMKPASHVKFNEKHERPIFCGRSCAAKTHGAKGSPGYSSWTSLLDRCRSTEGSEYRNYGSRGITVCERWRKFENFISDMGPKPSPQHSLDRIDNDGNYEPGNCRWATKKEQARNRRTNTPVIRDDGLAFATIEEAAEATGLKSSSIGAVCRGKMRTHKGHAWKYQNPTRDRMNG